MPPAAAAPDTIATLLAAWPLLIFIGSLYVVGALNHAGVKRLEKADEKLEAHQDRDRDTCARERISTGEKLDLLRGDIRELKTLLGRRSRHDDDEQG
jgi:hypothetical protein